MGQRNGRSKTSPRAEEHFSVGVAAWILRNRDLLDALRALRALGDEGADAVEAALSIRRVDQLRAGWELCVALAEGDGRSPYAELTHMLSAAVLQSTVEALWGSPGEAPQDVRLRLVK